MISLDAPGVAALLDAPNHAAISTHNPDGSIHTALVWQEVVDGKISVNTAIGRHWPTNLEADSRVTLLVAAADNPYDYVEIRGRAVGTTLGADAQIDRLAKKYLGAQTYPFREPTEQRISYVITAERVRHQKQG
jgi:PPOX class probable F420-dependent enzyme